MYAGMIFSFLEFRRSHTFSDQNIQLDGDAFKGSISYDTPMLYALGFIGLFTLAA
jgi:cytochrome c oxidase subunit 1